jgi:UDP-N-acetylglucosamine--N-acetylmuramyl-(pentapeptide) pyrophosphoryl-undecaprenol N-acetylglucosamine transferase
MGGSQGARTINQTVAALITERALPDDWQILHISGERDYVALLAGFDGNAAGKAFRLVPYLPDPADAYAAADIVVARAGASTLAELAATSTPAVLVPFPFAAEDHQRANAALFAAAGAAVVLADSDLNPQSLLAVLTAALVPERRAAMRAAAALLSPGGAGAKIVERITALRPGRVADSGEPNI